MDINLVALIGYNDQFETYELKNGKLIPYDFSYLRDTKNFSDIAKVVDGLGPSINMILEVQNNKALTNNFVKEANKANLFVHVYTLRADSLPSYAKTIEELFELILFEAGANGIFTDFPDLGINFLNKKQ